MMFSTYTFAEPTFADSSVSSQFITPPSHGGARFGVKKKRKQYEIYDRIYWLTDEEFRQWHKEHLKLKKQLKNKTTEELFDIVQKKEPKFKHLSELIIKPVFEIGRLEIPLVPKLLSTDFDRIALNKLAELHQQYQDHLREIEFAKKVEISRIKKLKKQEEEILLVLMMI